MYCIYYITAIHIDGRAFVHKKKKLTWVPKDKFTEW